MTDRKEAMDKLIAQDADLIDPVRDERQETIKLCLRNAIDWESIGNHKSAEFWRKVAGEIQTVDQQAAEIERLKRALWKIEFEVQQAFALDEPLTGQAGSEA